MLKKEWTTEINGKRVTFEPTGRLFTYCGAAATEIEYCVNYGTHLSCNKLIIEKHATRADVEERFS